jgi:hypothetical protein
MPIQLKTITEINAIIDGNGEVSLLDGLIALRQSTGVVDFTQKIGLWRKFSGVEQEEALLLDADMPVGWWRRIQERAPAAAMSGRRVRWTYGNWSVGEEGGDLLVSTPMMDEGSNALLSPLVATG